MKHAGGFLKEGTIAGLVQTVFPSGTYMPHIAFLIFVTPYIAEAVGAYIRIQFVSTVEIEAQDEIYNYIMTWVARNSLSQQNHRLLASSTVKHDAMAMFDPKAASDDQEIDEDMDDIGAETSLDVLRSRISLYNARPVHWTPGIGTHYFRYENRFLSFTRSVESQSSNMFAPRKESISISCLGRDATVLKRLIYNARIEYLERQRGKTSVYRAAKTYGDELGWSKSISRATRPMSTIALEDSLKEGLIKDLTQYLNPRTKRWYATRGIPYRRGYLFSGPPGTGKTSLTLAAAGLMGLNIYMISLNSSRLSEDSLAGLFRDLPRTCLVLLEDIDAAGLTHKRKPEPEGAKTGERREAITLSGLLNVIDGVGAHEGRVLVMTSNHTENIDPALLRPGRVDFSVQFGLATSDMAAQMFTQMYEDHAVSVIEKQPEGGILALTNTDSLATLADDFRRQVPELVFSPAAIQGYLLTHQNDPEGAVDAVEAWVEEADAARNTVAPLLMKTLPDLAESLPDSEGWD